MPRKFSIPTSAQGIGKRIFIRRPTRADENEFMEQILRSKKFLYPWIAYKTHISFFENYLSRFEQGSVGHFICSNHDGAILGVININDVVQGAFYNGYLGFYAFYQNAGKGFMSEGMELVLRRAFTSLNLHRLEANIQPQNLLSKQFVERHGFSKEGFSPHYLKIGGRWRDHERWALVRESWEEQQKSAQGTTLPPVMN